MKKILLFSSILIISCSCKKTNSTPTDPVVQDTLNSWVKYLVSDSTNSLYDVWFINQNVGFTINNYSLFQTSDGGKSWKIVASIEVGYNIQFLDSLNGFIQGNNFFTTSDGGKTWTKKNSGQGIYFQFVNKNIGFYFNYGDGLYSTHDGGNNWTAIFKPTTIDTEKYPFYFLDSLTGFSMMNGSCYKTRDGGANWDIVSNVTAQQFNGFYKMQFLDTLNGYCGAPNELLKTTDGGKTWTMIFKAIEYNPNIHTFIIPQFFDVNNGYVMTSSGIYKTTNGGKDWTTSCRVSKKNISGIHFLDMNTGWASTFDGYVLKLN
ncbi:MAG TPA: YCF48-related protein [Aquella sp.]|nr:YCF48-related protein [Aquella sp.]